jgi:hypothetical protein
VAAERSDAGRFIVHADQELPAFLELESAIQTNRHNHECDIAIAKPRVEYPGTLDYAWGDHLALFG